MARSDLGGGHSPLLGRLWSPKRGGGAGQAWEGTFSPLLPGVHFSLSQVLPCTWCPAPGAARAPGVGVGGLGSCPFPTPLFTAARGRVLGTAAGHSGSCKPIPRRGGRGHGPAAAGLGRRVGFQREPLGTSVERADAAASHGPARRPPALCWGCSCRRLPRSTAGGKGERHLGHRPLSDSRDTVLASPRRPHPASLQPSLRKPG